MPGRPHRPARATAPEAVRCDSCHAGETAALRELKGSDRRYLRGLANPLKAVVQLGEAGLTDAVVAATDAALLDHELVKVRIAAERDERKSLAMALAKQTNSALAGLVGRVAILYRPAAEPAKRKIRLPTEANP